MSSLPARELPPEPEPAADLPQLLCGFPLTELRSAMPPVATTSTELVKPEFLDQFAIDRAMSATESEPITPFVSTSPGPR